MLRWPFKQGQMHMALPVKFNIVVLGCMGGPGEQNLSSYLIAPIGSSNYAALDAGTLLPGIVMALKKKRIPEVPVTSYQPLVSEFEVLKNHVKAYLISHAHLDHVAGLIIDSPGDSKKQILGIDSTIDYIRDHLFNGAIWPNFSDEGEHAIGQYSYLRLPLGEKRKIPGTSMCVETYPLNHPCGYLSSAFLIEEKASYVLYVGNTSPDALEKKKCLHDLWKRVTPLIREDKLHAIFIECSYPDSAKDEELYGHLKPSYLMQELESLAHSVNSSHPEKALQKLKIFVVHIKSSSSQGLTYEEQVQMRLKELNRYHLPLFFPKQTDLLVV